ncbi:MAG: MBL fold metallo-hydrolase [Omnitrophica WOR_2 bacterium]
MNANEKKPMLQAFKTSGGSDIFQIPLEAFPGFWGYVYLVLSGEYRVLIDSGSGLGEASSQLEQGFETISSQYHESISLANLTHILITHGHIDHFGGLTYICPRTSARIGVHELDRRNLTNYEERLTVVARRLSEFLTEAGASPELREKLLEMYMITKAFFRSVRVDFTYEAIGMQLGPFEFLHVPGHCAGHVVIRLDDILFSGDHILEDTSPHQSPEHLTLSTGLDHYLHSLEAARPWARQARMALGGHKQPVMDVEKRLDEIKALHKDRLQKVLDFLKEPHTISDVSHHLFQNVSGYNILLALEEAGAHVEYLYQRGLLEIENLDALEASDKPVPIIYRCIECTI